MVSAEIKPATQVYVGLSQDHRVSRSFRATWFLHSLSEGMSPLQESGSADLSVLSVLGGSQVAASTDVFYLCQQYSLVFVLDMSPTMMAVSNMTFSVKVDEAVSSLCACLQLLAQPFQAPGSSVKLEPQLCVTVIAYCGATASKEIPKKLEVGRPRNEAMNHQLQPVQVLLHPVQVLLQGVYLHQENCKDLSALLKEKTKDHENTLSKGCAGSLQSSQARDDLGSNGDSSLEGMVRAGTLAIQLLPRNALKGLVLLTDGIPGFSSPTAMHTAVNGMRGANISCWVVHVGGKPHPSAAFGLIPDTETLAFMAQACNGCVMQPEKLLHALHTARGGSLEANAVQLAVLFWTFQFSARSFRVRELVGEGEGEGEDYFTPTIHRVSQRYAITAPLLCVTGCRIREGFFLKDVVVKELSLEVQLSYPWQPGVTINYTIVAPWPVSDSSATLQVTTSYNGPYSFVQDVQENTPLTSHYRVQAVRKFKQALKALHHSDSLLAHFLTFAATPTCYTLPQRIQDGMPLFYLPPNQAKPVPTADLSSSGEKKGRESPLIRFWNPLCTIDTSLWYRWFHSDKIVVVLNQDSFLPRNLLTPSPTGRFTSLQCRIAASRLFDFLKQWSSFVLLDSHSFIRFLPSRESPKYFCLIRVAQKHPCVVLHVGHVEGTPHSLQSETMSSLYASLRGLSTSGGERPTGTLKRRLTPLLKLHPCITVIDKQLQRVMIRYDNAPGIPTQSLIGGESERLTQMDYLSCSRWLWRVPHSDPVILSALLRHRLKEGFRLSSAHNGVVTLTAQLTMEQESSAHLQMLLQYVIFPHEIPPHEVLPHEVSPLQTELWVEPQCGSICGTPPGLGYLRGLQHQQIREKIHEVDVALVTSIASFFHLHHCCEKTSPAQSPLRDGGGAPSMSPEECHIPFQLSSLLGKSQLLAFTLTAFSEVTGETVNLRSCSPLNYHFRQQLANQLKPLAPVTFPLSSAQPFLDRILSSPTLEEFCRASHISESTTELYMKCFALRQENDIYVFFIPSYFSSLSSSGESSALVMPLLLLHCSQEVLMDPDPAQPDSPSLLPDVYHHLTLTATTHQPSPGEKQAAIPLQGYILQLVSKLQAIHVSSYLHTIHFALCREIPVSPHDFLSGMGICDKTVLSVDFTPLIAALCYHATAWGGDSSENKPAPLQTEMLCLLLVSVLSKMQSTCRLSLSDPELMLVSHCEKWSGEIEKTFLDYLSEAGFQGVPSRRGYYWLRNTAQCQRHDVEASSDDSEPLPTHPEHSPFSPLSPSSPSSPSPLSPTALSPTSTLKKQSFSIDEANTETLGLDETPSSGGGMEALSPLFSFLGKEDPDGGSPLHTPAPLFLHMVSTVRSSEGEVTREEVLPPTLPICLKSVLPDGASTGSYTVTLEFVFLSSPEGHRSPTHEATLTTMAGEGGPVQSEGATLHLSPSYQAIALSLKNKVEWLIADELVSVSRETTPITPALLQAVATHIQTSREHYCLSQQVPLKFVFGPTHSMLHFISQLEAIEVPMYSIRKVDEYYYLASRPHPSSPALTHDHTPESELAMELPLATKPLPSPVERSKTPPPLTLTVQRKLGHRRSISAGYPPGHAPHARTPSRIGSYCTSSVASLAEVGEVASGYEASRSSVSSLSDPLPEPLDSDTQEAFWLVLRVLPDQVQIYFQMRGSQQGVDFLHTKFQSLCEVVANAVRKTCKETNQWFLLKDMLETRLCRPLLLPESPSEAWVDEVAQKHLPQEGVVQGGPGGMFRPLEFQCDLVWRKHLTLHWRLKAMRMQAALGITRMALSAFAVSNRTDVYVLQDVKENGEETIFYLKIDESLCQVEDDSQELEDSITVAIERSETRANVEVDSLSSYSFRQSISELPEMDRRGTSSSIEVPPQAGKPQESLVLQLYGIAQPSLSIKERLGYIVQSKLDDAALEMVCGLYARNPKLRLTTADIQFLQPSLKEPSHVFSIALPAWLPSVEAFVFYYLQSLSTMALKPKYISHDPRELFQVPLEVQNAYLMAGLPTGAHQDHIFLYIRPHTQGRGIAVISASVANPGGRIMVPQPGVVSPATEESGVLPVELAQALQCQIEEISQDHPPTGCYALRIHIWEKGNVGMADLSFKLESCFKHAMCDCLLELYLLPTPIARVGEMPEDVCSTPASVSSPFIFIEGPESPLKRTPEKSHPDRGRPPSRSSVNDLDTSSMPRRSRRDTDLIIQDMEEVLQSIEHREGSSEEEVLQTGDQVAVTWHQKERLRREQEARHAFIRDAYFGNTGILELAYHTTIPQHLSRMQEVRSPSVVHYSFSLLGSYSAQSFLSQALASIHQLCPDISLNAFQLVSGDPPHYTHLTPEKDYTKARRKVEGLSDFHYLVVGRNPHQWEESCKPSVPDFRISQPWLDPQTKQPLQLYHPLDSRKFHRNVEVPFQLSGHSRNTFIPRQRLVIISITRDEVELWLYNVAEEVGARMRHHLGILEEWQGTRVGFLHHLLAQKMGLFQHTHGQDLRSYTEVASKHCSTLQEVAALVKSPSPISTETTPTRSLPRSSPAAVVGPVAIETFYQETPPHGHTPITADPVFNHGKQFRETHQHQRRVDEGRELLGKVFTSWQSRSGKPSAPVSTTAIATLKKTARLLHYITSPLLLRQSAVAPPDTQDSAWFEQVREEALSLYIQYLHEALGFQPINERPAPIPSRQRSARPGTPHRFHSPSSTYPPKLYKCLQRSWPGGIILIELSFKEEDFHVKLFTLESSRLVKQPPTGAEVYGLFSMECAKYKDFIHVHSFLHDFHLHFLLALLDGTRQAPPYFDIRRLLELFRKHNSSPPNFIRNRLCSDEIRVPVTVNSRDLFHHIVAHGGVFGMQTVELRPNPSSSTPRPDNIALLINVCPQSLGPTTSPQLSRILQDGQQNYTIRVLVLYNSPLSEDKGKHLTLDFYLLLVNKFDKYPRLTCDSPHLSASRHPLPRPASESPEDEEFDESELYLNVRKHRRKLGFGSLTSPPAASHLVLNIPQIGEQMRGLREHLEGVVRGAQCHMRRDELWKRMLYGRQRNDARSPSVYLDPLSCGEFRELLQLVTVCPLESLDPRLAPLKKQTKKWFRKLMSPLELRFQDNIKLYSSEDDCYRFAAIINPEWQDMFVLVQSDRDGRQHGFSAVYRKPQEGGVPLEERPITAHVEADRQHIETVVNFACSFLWASILDTSPPQPHLSLL